MRPLIAVTMDIQGGRLALAIDYVEAIHAAGGQAIPWSAPSGSARELVQRVDGVVLTGGGDPDLRPFGVSLHERVDLIDPRRQSAEFELLSALDERPMMPVLGICLGMQLMGLRAGGHLIQHLPDVLASAAQHAGNNEHEVDGEIGAGRVVSSHHQALADAGRCDVLARAPDGVIEAIRDARRRHAIGVQWHPERTRDSNLGERLFRDLIAAARVRDRGRAGRPGDRE